MFHTNLPVERTNYMNDTNNGDAHTRTLLVCRLVVVDERRDRTELVEEEVERRAQVFHEVP